MKLSYEGIGQWAATFACANVAEGDVVKISGNGTVAACGDGDAFAGVVISVGHGGDACSAALGGMATAVYSGTVPAVGWAGLCADGTGGVKAASDGHSYLVTDVNTSTKTVTFAL